VVEENRPSIITTIEKADAYNERMLQDFRQLLLRTKEQASDFGFNVTGKEAAHRPKPTPQTSARPIMPFNTTDFRVMIASAVRCAPRTSNRARSAQRLERSELQATVNGTPIRAWPRFPLFHVEAIGQVRLDDNRLLRSERVSSLRRIRH